MPSVPVWRVDSQDGSYVVTFNGVVLGLPRADKYMAELHLQTLKRRYVKEEAQFLLSFGVPGEPAGKRKPRKRAYAYKALGGSVVTYQARSRREARKMVLAALGRNTLPRGSGLQLVEA